MKFTKKTVDNGLLNIFNCRSINVNILKESRDMGLVWLTRNEALNSRTDVRALFLLPFLN